MKRVLALINQDNAAWLQTLIANDRYNLLVVEVTPGQPRRAILENLKHSISSGDTLLVPAHLKYSEQPQAVDCGGVELLKHLRFLPMRSGVMGMGALTRMSVIIALEHSPAYYARRTADNSILFSPGCAVLRGPFGSRTLHETLDTLTPFADRDVMRRILRPYAVATAGQENEQEHSLRNKAGVVKFLSEFSGHVIGTNDPLRQHIEAVEEELWLCKLRFKNSFESCKPSQLDTDFVDSCQKAHFVYVDDQHREGWSYGLYAGLFLDNVNEAGLRQARDLLKNTDSGEISLAKDHLVCIDNETDAEEYFGYQRDEFDKALQAWADEDTHIRAGAFSSHVRSKFEIDLREQAKTDVVFLDMRLSSKDEAKRPEKTSGVLQLEAIKAKFPHVSVIMLTASQKARSVKATAKADEFWVKAESSGQELRDAVKQALDFSLVRALWLRVRQVEARHDLPISRYDDFDRKFNALTARAEFDQARSEILQFLQMSLSLLQSALQANNETDRDTYSRFIILNMGIIQEARLQQFETARQQIFIQGEELGLRALRNKVGAHSTEDLSGLIKSPLFVGNFQKWDWRVTSSNWIPVKGFIGDPSDPNAKQPGLLEEATLGVFAFTLNQLLSDF